MRLFACRCLGILFLLGTIAAYGQKKQPPAPALPPGIDAYINKVLATFGVPGISIAIVREGKVLLAKGYGVRKAGSPEQVDSATLFLIASNSKTFTATAIGMLVEEGKLKWDDRVTDHLPWFKMADPYVTNNVTVRDILVHHTGLAAFAGDGMLFPPSSFTRKQLVQKIRELPLVHDFRSVYAYNNLMYVAAGELIEAVSGTTWENFVKTRILDKLGMTQTLSVFSDIKTKTNIAWAHVKEEDSLQVIENFRDIDVGNAGAPAGGIVSNATDIAKWLITQLDSGRAANQYPLFQPATSKVLWNMIQPIPVAKVPDVLKPTQYNFYAYSPGFRSYNYGATKIVGHGGYLTGFASQTVLVPELKLGIAVFTNQAATAPYWVIIYQLLDYYLKNKPYNWIKAYKENADTLTAQSKRNRKPPFIALYDSTAKALPLEKYTGSFKDVLLGEAIIEKEGKGLVLRFANHPYYTADLVYFQFNSFKVAYRTRHLSAHSYLSFSFKPNGAIDGARLWVNSKGNEVWPDDIALKPVAAAAASDTLQLSRKITAAFRQCSEGEFAMAFKDLTTGETLLLNAAADFHAASTMKTPVLVEAYKQAAENKFKLSDSILVHTTFKSIVDGSPFSLDSSMDSEKEIYKWVNTNVTIATLLYKMITKSCNLATNILIEKLGAENVMTTMKSIGATHLRVLRGVEDAKAFQLGLNNTVTAYDLMLVFDKIASGTMVNAQACEGMIHILLQQTFNSMIPARLPAGVTVAHKTGGIQGICHDSGIIFLPDGRKYVLVLLSKGITRKGVADEVLAGVSREVYDYMMQKKAVN